MHYEEPGHRVGDGDVKLHVKLVLELVVVVPALAKPPGALLGHRDYTQACPEVLPCWTPA